MSFKVKDWEPIKKYYNQFLNAELGAAVQGLNYNSADTWIKDREIAYQHYAEEFRIENLIDHEKAVKTYVEWLKPTKNKSWSNMSRSGKQAIKQPNKLSTLLKYLQDENIPVTERVQNGLAGKYKVDHIGPGILTAFLHTIFPEKYCVWNYSTYRTMKKFNISTTGLWSYQKGTTYSKINKLLHEMAKQNNTNLNYIDCFMWYVATKLPERLRL